MPRPLRYRRMQRPPLIKGMKPYGSQTKTNEKVLLQYDEYETIRLMDFEMLNQQQGAALMKVSRPTFTRIYDSARKKIAKALVLSAQIEIQGGNVDLEGNWYECLQCAAVFDTVTDNKDNQLHCPHCGHHGFDSINARIRGFEKPKFNYHQANSNTGHTYCVCKTCGFSVSHKKGVPCCNILCPNCNTSLQKEIKPIQMKTAISCHGEVNAPLFDLKFGRAQAFAIIENGKILEVVDNPAKNEQGGAGPAAASFVAKLGVKQVVSGHYGPKAASALQTYNVQMQDFKEEDILITDLIKQLF